ncbi:family 1 carbohydrate esterase [Stachybotrys elegans]|uniref:feruloyl esterase n=1 Tax=Stachybotrys elegans TaxID=80388 RepID=A0A8K0SKV9_9HYPO|nr:family 1 carbohydrate esterase [Stachybotrys elegans]
MAVFTNLLKFGVALAALCSVVVAQSGCGIPVDFPGQTRTFSISSSGGTRRFLVHLPSNYNPSTRTPVIVAYHGSGASATGFEPYVRFSQPAVNPNMIAVYPAGINGNWQGPTYATPGVNDMVFTTDMVNYLRANFCVDESRIYAAGFSNGGGFVNTLACSRQHGGQFAAFGGVSSALYTDVSGNTNCTPARSPLPLIQLHGYDDGTIRYEGGQGRGGPLPGILEWLSRWATRNSCGQPTILNEGNGVANYTWDCAGRNDAMQHYRLYPLGHNWPGPTGLVDISAEMVRFFSRHRRP